MLSQKKERWMLLTLAAIQFTNIVDFMIVMPLGPQLMRLFSINPQQFSLIVSSYTISAGISGFLSAFFIDKFDRKHALQVCYAGFLLGTLACAFAPGFVLLLAARILTGAFGGVLASLVLSALGDTIPLERRSRAMGLVMTAFSLASVMGVPFGLYLASHFSWHAPFLFLAALGLFIHIAIIYNVPSINHHLNNNQKKKFFSVITNVTGNPNQIRALGLTMFLMLGQFTVIPFISPYMVSNVGFTEKQLPYIYFLGGIVSILSLPIIGRLADKHGRLRVFTFGMFLSLIPLFLITNIQRVEMWVALLVTTFFFLVMGGRMIPATTMTTAAVEPQNRGSFMSINSSVQQLSAGLASFIAGALIYKTPGGTLMGYDKVGYIAIVSSLICLWLARGVKPVSSN